MFCVMLPTRSVTAWLPKVPRRRRRSRSPSVAAVPQRREEMPSPEELGLKDPPAPFVLCPLIS